MKKKTLFIITVAIAVFLFALNFFASADLVNDFPKRDVPSGSMETYVTSVENAETTEEARERLAVRVESLSRRIVVFAKRREVISNDA